MGLQLFDELNRTTASYCRALGLDASPYETPLSPDEVLIANERRWLVERGMRPEKAAVWAQINVRHGVSNKPHAVVEYANQGSLWDRQRIDPAEYKSRDGMWSGD